MKHRFLLLALILLNAAPAHAVPAVSPDSDASAALLALSPTGRPSGGAYVDPSQLDMPWPKFSFFKVPWRGYLETVPGTRFRDGLGVAWSQKPKGMSDDAMAAALEAAGFRRVRIEIPWNAIAWNEHDFAGNAKRELTSALLAFKAHHLRPLILLNANSGAPGPTHQAKFTLTTDAPAGAREIRLNGYLGALQPWHEELLSGAGKIRPLLTSIDASTGAAQLSAPVGHALAKGTQVTLMTHKYLPLYPVGTPQFAETAAGWQRYVALVSDFVARTYGSDDFDVEIWNELSFGSAFVSIDNYTQPRLSSGTKAPDFLHPGGSAWTLAQQTVEFLKAHHPHVKVIWGFSNTSFFHTPIEQLPPSIDGQSYHPYGTGKRCFSQAAPRMQYSLDGALPDFCAVQPEGWAHMFQQTESLMRLLNPTARQHHPPGTSQFEHFITEHGFVPKEAGITDPAAARAAKAKFALRSTLFWLNKGLSAIYLFHAWESSDAGMGFLAPDGGQSPATLALGHLAAAFAGARALPSVRQLSVELDALGPEHPVFAAPGGAPALYDRDVVAVLPFQLSEHKFIVAVYVMTEDFPKDLAPEPYQITLGGIDGEHAKIRYYNPLNDSEEPAVIAAHSKSTLAVRLRASDDPALLEIND